MMERPSRQQNQILKRALFRAGPDLRSVDMITFKSSSATVKHTGQCWKTTSKPIPARATSHSLAPQIASTGTHPAMLSP